MDGQTRVKTLPSLVLRTRAVKTCLDQQHSRKDFVNSSSTRPRIRDLLKDCLYIWVCVCDNEAITITGNKDIV